MQSKKRKLKRLIGVVGLVIVPFLLSLRLLPFTNTNETALPYSTILFGAASGCLWLIWKFCATSKNK